MSRTYVQARDDILRRAFRICRTHATKQLPDSDDVANGVVVFDGLLNHLNAIDRMLWSKTWATIPLTATSNVLHGGSYYRCIRSHTSAAGTEPGVGTDWTSYWYLDGGATSGAVAWALSTVYSCAGDFVYNDAYGIASAFLRYNNSDYPIACRDLSELFQDLDLRYTGIPVRLMFDRQNTYRIFLNPIPDTSVAASAVLHVMRVNFIAEVTTAGTNAPIPPEYQDALVYMLAGNLGDEYGVPISRITRLENKGRALWTELNRSPHKELTNDSKIKPCF